MPSTIDGMIGMRDARIDRANSSPDRLDRIDIRRRRDVVIATRPISVGRMSPRRHCIAGPGRSAGRSRGIVVGFHAMIAACSWLARACEVRAGSGGAGMDGMGKGKGGR